VVAPFGVRGEMKVNIHTEFPERLASMDEVILAPFEYASGDASSNRPSRRPDLRPRNRSPHGITTPKKPTPFQVETTRVHKGQMLLKVRGVDGPEAVESLKNCWVLVPIEKAKKLPRGAYYLYQIEGLDVYDTNRRHIGKIQDVLTLTANDVYVVRGPGVTDPTGELLVPAIKSVVKRVEMKRGRIVIAPIEDWT
jgi:16S rRNA processing protein RimM